VLIPGALWQSVRERHDDEIPRDAAPRRAWHGLVGRRADGVEFPVGVVLDRLPLVDGVTEPLFAVALHEASVTFDHAPYGVFMDDAQGRWIDVNPAGCDMLGYRLDELVGKEIADFLPPEQVPRLHEAREYLRVPGRVHDAPWKLRRKDGRYVPVEVRATIIPGGLCQAFVRDISLRVQREERLGRVTKLLDSIVENVPAMIFLKNAEDLRFERFNRAGEELLGIPREDMLGKNDHDFFPPEQAAFFQSRDRETLEKGRLVATEEPIRTTRGLRWLHTQKIPIADETGTARYLLGISMDITDRKRADEALRRSEENLKRAQRVAHLGSWTYDAKTEQVSYTPEIAAICGLETTEAGVSPMAVADRVHPEDRERVIRAVGEASAAGAPFAVEHRVVRPSGEERTVLQQGEVLLDADGRREGLVGTVLDITERKRVEREREDSLRWLGAVLDQSPVGLMLFHGPDGDRVEFNRRAEEMAGGPILGLQQLGAMIVSPEGAPVPLDRLPCARALRGERTEGEELLLRGPNGKTTPISASAAPILGKDGRVEGAVVAIQDITAAKQLEHLRAEWNSVVAHDLRQPIGLIKLSTQILARILADASVQRIVRRMQSAVGRLNRMVADLMDLSRLEARRLELLKRPVDVPALVRGSVEVVALEAPDRPFDVSVHGEAPKVDADADRVSQVMENLLINAVKYGKSGTPIVVDVEHEESAVAVAVTNEGHPLPPDESEHIFDRFHRTALARRNGVQGDGLGLYITRALVEAHGGHITVDSSPAGRTTFRFTLPVTPPVNGR
jgi:PAS domain S-box-containing protein